MDLRSGKKTVADPMDPGDTDERKEHDDSWRNTSLDDIAAEHDLDQPIVGTSLCIYIYIICMYVYIYIYI
jgi:hypothetical protein